MGGIYLGATVPVPFLLIYNGNIYGTNKAAVLMNIEYKRKFAFIAAASVYISRMIGIWWMTLFWWNSSINWKEKENRNIQYAMYDFKRLISSENCYQPGIIARSMQVGNYGYICLYVSGCMCFFSYKSLYPCIENVRFNSICLVGLCKNSLIWCGLILRCGTSIIQITKYLLTLQHFSY